MSEQAHVDAVVAKINAVDGRAFTIDQLTRLSAPPTSYNEVYVMRRLEDAPDRFGDPSDASQWRVVVRSVAKTFGNAQVMRDRAAVLHRATLVVEGETFYSRRALGDDPIGPDDGWFSGTSEFRY